MKMSGGPASVKYQSYTAHNCSADCNWHALLHTNSSSKASGKRKTDR